MLDDDDELDGQPLMVAEIIDRAFLLMQSSGRARSWAVGASVAFVAIALPFANIDGLNGVEVTLAIHDNAWLIALSSLAIIPLFIFFSNIIIFLYYRIYVDRPPQDELAFSYVLEHLGSIIVFNLLVYSGFLTSSLCSLAILMSLVSVFAYAGLGILSIILSVLWGTHVYCHVECYGNAVVFGKPRDFIYRYPAADRDKNCLGADF